MFYYTIVHCGWRGGEARERAWTKNNNAIIHKPYRDAHNPKFSLSFCLLIFHMLKQNALYEPFFVQPCLQLKAWIYRDFQESHLFSLLLFQTEACLFLMSINLNHTIYGVDVAYWFKFWIIPKTHEQTPHFSVEYTKGFLWYFREYFVYVLWNNQFISHEYI